jgi:hypothetical protein
MLAIRERIEPVMRMHRARAKSRSGVARPTHSRVLRPADTTRRRLFAFAAAGPTLCVGVT